MWFKMMHIGMLQGKAGCGSRFVAGCIEIRPVGM